MLGLTFLQPALLWGLALAGIPILLHLLQRRRFKVRHWAAMEFLRASVRRSSRRLRIEQWLLLLVRTLILVFAALALARPVWHSPRWGWLGSRAAAQVVLVLDDSYSMAQQSQRSAASGANPKSKIQNPKSFDWARARALDLVQQGLTSGDQVSIVLAGEPARALIRRPTFNLAEVTQALQRAPVSDRRTDLAGAARLCTEILQASRAAAREVYLITDLQAVAWQRPEVAEAWRRVATAGRLHVIAPGGARTPNLAVDEVRVSDPVTPGRPVPIQARLSNHGDRAATGVVVTLHADGRAVTSARTDVPAGGAADVRFEHAFPRAGPHTLTVALPDDALAVDNRGYASVVARPQTRVLVLNGHPDPDPRRDAAFFLAAALAPDGSAGAGGLSAPNSDAALSSLSPFEVRVLEGGSFQGEDLSRWDVVVLADVPRLGEGARRALASFAAEGGGVLVLPGPSVVASYYNSDLLRREPALLPARLGPIRNAGAAAPGLDLERVDHPALVRFRGAADVDLTTARFARYYQLEALDPSTGSQVVCRFTDAAAGGGDEETEGEARLSLAASRPPSGTSPGTASPAIAERAVGLGRVVLLAVPLSPEWSTLPFKPAFLPFLHGLVAYLGQGPGSQRNLQVGDPLVWAVPAAGRPSATGSWLVEAPDGKQTSLRPSRVGKEQTEAWVVRLEALAQAGLYRLRPQTPGAAVGAWYAANLRTEESDLRALSRREFDGKMEAAPVRWVAPHETMAAVVREGRQGREAWRGLLFAALALLLCESGMAQIFGRRREGS